MQSGNEMSSLEAWEKAFPRVEITPAILMTREEFEAIHLAIEPLCIPPRVEQAFLGPGKDGKIALDDPHYEMLKVALAMRFKKYKKWEGDSHLPQVHYKEAFNVE